VLKLKRNHDLLDKVSSPLGEGEPFV